MAYTAITLEMIKIILKIINKHTAIHLTENLKFTADPSPVAICGALLIYLKFYLSAFELG